MGSKDQETWDEDDVMIFLWGNTKAAKEHHLKKASDSEMLAVLSSGREVFLVSDYTNIVGYPFQPCLR